MSFLSADEQLKRIEENIEELLPREEFRERLERAARDERPLRIKQGFDPTAPDIHLGHTVGLRKLRQFQELGHQVVLIVGDYTSLVGDPSGRSATRPQLELEQVEENAKSYLEQFFKVVDAGRTQVLRNGDWFSAMAMRDLIRMCARYTVARMLERDDFQKRWDAKHPISVHELLYPLMQGFDSVMIRCDLELGATEQKFNLLVGRALQEDYARGEMPWCEPYIPESVRSVPVPRQGQAILTLPILVGVDGVQRMSKSLGNYIGVSEPANVMYEKLMRVPDEIIVDYLRLLVPHYDPLFQVAQDWLREGQLQKASSGGAALAGRNFVEAHKCLAKAVTAMYYGEVTAEQAGESYDRGGRGLTESRKLVELPATEQETTRIAYVVVSAGLAKSTSEAIRLLKQGGVHYTRRSSGAVSGAVEALKYAIEAGTTQVWAPAIESMEVKSVKGAAPIFLRKGKRQETTVEIRWV